MGVFSQLGLEGKEIAEKSILDIGCGSPRAIDSVRKHMGIDLTGLDLTPYRSSENFVNANGVYLPFPNDSFDIVISHKGLPGKCGSELEVGTAIEEMIRVAREKVIFSCPIFNDRNLETPIRMGDGGSFSFALGLFLQGLRDEKCASLAYISSDPQGHQLPHTSCHIEIR